MIRQLSSSQPKTQVEKLLVSLFELLQQLFIGESTNLTSFQLSAFPS